MAFTMTYEYHPSIELAIRSIKGQLSLQYEVDAAAIFERWWPQYHYVHTDKTKPIYFDAYLTKNGKKVAIVETKCRYDMDYKTFVTVRKNKWMLTEKKLLRNAIICANERLPLYGFLYFTQCKTLLVKQLGEKSGRLREYERRKTTTTADINGGSITDWNAFIDMYDSRKMV